MNVYKINQYWIAAKNADSAFGQFIEETNNLDDVFIGDLEEGEEDEYLIKIKRLTSKEMDFETITCCNDGCSECEDLDEPVLYSFREQIEKMKSFPCVVCWEE